MSSYIEQVIPGYKEEVKSGLVGLLINKDTLGWLFRGAVDLTGSIVQNTVGRLFNRIVRFV